MNWSSTLERVVANQKSLTPAKVLLTIVTLPFLVLGWVIGLVWLIGSLVWSATWVGVQQARDLSAFNRQGDG